MLIDIGVNLTNKAFAGDRDAVIERALEAGVTRMIVTGTDPATCEAALELVARWPGVLYMTAGVHPHHAVELDDAALGRIEQLAREPAVVAIGECGLDFNRNYSPPEVQQQAFAAQLELAASVQLPVFMHQRDAHAACMRLLQPQRRQLANVVAHCFTDTEQALREYLALDLHIGITGWICDERRGIELQRLVGLIPAQRLMLETDAPFLLPRDLPGAKQLKRNEPASLPHIAAAVARHRDEAVGQLMEQVTSTTEAFFGLEPGPVNKA